MIAEVSIGTTYLKGKISDAFRLVKLFREMICGFQKNEHECSYMNLGDSL